MPNRHGLPRQSSGALIEAWASQKSFRPKGEKEPPPSGDGGEVNFHGTKRSNETHLSTSDPEARLYKKSKGAEAKLAYLGHAVMENRNGLLVRTCVTQATGTAEREAALRMMRKIARTRPVTLGADKAYDVREFVEQLREQKVTPHLAQNQTRRGGSTLDERTTRHPGYRISQQKRKRIEQSFGWLKMIGMLKKVKLRRRAKIGWLFTFVGAAYNLCRLARLEAAATA